MTDNFKKIYSTSHPVYSFEVFPPKDEAGIADLMATLGQLKSYQPAFVSVTYGAGGSTRDLTRDLALRIRDELNLNVAFHFTCVGSSRDDIKVYVEKLKQKGVSLVVALRGDPPKGEKHFTSAKDGFSHASELVTYLKSLGGFSMAVAGYPEMHVEAKSKDQDLAYLKQKVDQGADVVMTQLFYDNKDYFDFVERARQIGIEVPIIPGILPVLSLQQVVRITGLSGAKIPPRLLEKLQACGDDSVAMRDVGIEWALCQARELVQKGVPGIHFYILNRSYSIAKILSSL